MPKGIDSSKDTVKYKYKHYFHDLIKHNINN